jgi:hypothetical protein
MLHKILETINFGLSSDASAIPDGRAQMAGTVRVLRFFAIFLSHQTYVWIVPKITVQLLAFLYFPLYCT